jgi:hypothetical protein
MNDSKSVGVNTILAAAAILGVGGEVEVGWTPAKPTKQHDSYDRQSISHAATRRLVRMVKQHRAILKGGFPIITLSPMRLDPDHICDSTRGERRRAKLGRA